MNKNELLGKWNISEMEMWDNDYINAETSGYIFFDKNNNGEFHFGYVHGFMDCQYIENHGNTIVEFTWNGNDEMEYANGRGFAKINEDGILGKIFIHNGDNSEFKAIKT